MHLLSSKSNMLNRLMSLVRCKIMIYFHFSKSNLFRSEEWQKHKQHIEKIACIHSKYTGIGQSNWVSSTN